MAHFLKIVTGVFYLIERTNVSSNSALERRFFFNLAQKRFGQPLVAAYFSAYDRIAPAPFVCFYKQNFFLASFYIRMFDNGADRDHRARHDKLLPKRVNRPF